MDAVPLEGQGPFAYFHCEGAFRREILSSHAAQKREGARSFEDVRTVRWYQPHSTLRCFRSMRGFAGGSARLRTLAKPEVLRGHAFLRCDPGRPATVAAFQASNGGS
uniref:DUF663 domain-containing protein n=1 Tax=Ascaris lumbricoides TaxID=6252 RepID=A0A0M3I4K1_ASCLU